MILVIIIAGFLVTSARRSATESLAEGTWSCTAQGSEDEDIYGEVNNSPFEVVVGDGTFSIPSRYLSGRWSLSNGSLQIDSVWSKDSSRPTTSVRITGVDPNSLDQASGNSPMSFRPNGGSQSFDRTLSWTYTNGQFVLSGGTSIARTGVVCTKEADGGGT